MIEFLGVVIAGALFAYGAKVLRQGDERAAGEQERHEAEMAEERARRKVLTDVYWQARDEYWEAFGRGGRPEFPKHPFADTEVEP